MNKFKILGCGFAAAVGLGLGAGIVIPKIYDHKYAKTIDEAKNTIKAIAPDKFEKFQKEEKELGLFDNKINFWLKACKQIDDLKSKRTLNIDSLINKAYQDGAQMVRDSIKAASKLK